MRTKFSLLNASDFHIVFVKVILEFVFRCVDGIDVYLQDARHIQRRRRARALRTRRTRARVGGDAGDEEEDEDESSCED